MNCPKHLYIHWPFCKNKCHYCDFVAFEKHQEFIEAYHKALCEEIRRFAATIPHHADRSIKTIFFGGGTPSLYPLPLLKELFALLSASFDLTGAQEISLEVNPGGIYDEHLATWKELGINRLSIGVQVLDDEALKRLNRFQTCEEVRALFALLPTYFKNISADFIMGLPHVSAQSWNNTITEALNWPITHISTYLLMVHEQTPLYFKIKKGEVLIPSDNALTTLYTNTILRLEDAHFAQYEISNFAQEGHQSTHNQAYWHRRPYKGFGLGAASFDGTVRTTNIKNLKKYLDVYGTQCLDNTMVYHFSEELSEKQMHFEELMLSLRQRKGIDLHRMVYLINDEDKEALRKQIDLLKSHDLLQETNGIISLTHQGMMLENEIIVSLM